MPVEQMYNPNYFQHSYQQNQFNQKQKLNTTGFVNQSFAHGGPSSSNNHDQNLQQNIYHDNYRASIDGIYNIHAIEESTMENRSKNIIEQNHNSANTFVSETKNEFARQKAIVKETMQVIRSDYESQKEFLEFFKNHNKALEQLKNGFESKQHLNNYSKNFGNNGGIKINEQNNMNLHNYGNSFVFDQHTRKLMAGSSNHLNHLTTTELQKENYLENIKQKNLKDFQDLDKIHQLLQMQNLKK
uniref:Uncharacterized protein n=1 Tax=Meloidogyne enterolobii TaxID=390850 RepID=A0A6V7WBQ5_MELEN|nr:unnamed protein product [Meloidogyne enterolobii]